MNTPVPQQELPDTVLTDLELRRWNHLDPPDDVAITELQLDINEAQVDINQAQPLENNVVYEVGLDAAEEIAGRAGEGSVYMPPGTFQSHLLGEWRTMNVEAHPTPPPRQWPPFITRDEPVLGTTVEELQNETQRRIYGALGLNEEALHGRDPHEELIRDNERLRDQERRRARRERMRGREGFMEFDHRPHQDQMAWVRHHMATAELVPISIYAGSLSQMYTPLMECIRGDRTILNLRDIVLCGVRGVQPNRYTIGNDTETREIIEFQATAGSMTTRERVDDNHVSRGVNVCDQEFIRKCRNALVSAGLIPEDVRGMDSTVQTIIRRAIGNGAPE